MIAPAFNTIRQWVLKIGLYKLMRTKDKTGDWIHIIDATVQMGSQKAVLILGLRIDDPETALNPSFENLEPLVLKIVTKCNGEAIEEALKEAADKTGEPVATISDDGGEMNRGVKLRSATAPVVHLHDCVHKISNLFKARLKTNEHWSEFKTKATAMTQSVKLSAIAPLAPPKQRSKDRLLASVGLVKWGVKLLAYWDSKPDLSDELLEKIEWITRYRRDLQKWNLMHEMATTAIKVLLKFGYCRDAINEWEKEVAHISRRCSSLQWIYQGIKSIIEKESAKVPEGARYLACDIIIESFFGKYKSLEGAFVGSGITGLVLAIPALAGPTTLKDIEEAMESIHTEDVENWLENNLGQTFLSQRRAAFSGV